MRIELRPYRAGDGDALLRRGLRPADRREARKAAGLEPGAAVSLSLARSVCTVCILLEGRVSCLIGIGLLDILENSATPWLLAHEDFEDARVAVPMARRVKRCMDHWLTVFSRLENVVDPDHAAAIRLLEWMDFTIETTGIRGPLGHSLLPFWRNSECA